MLHQIPKICVIDENPRVKVGWEESLGQEAQLHFYPDHKELYKEAANAKALIASFYCVVIGRLYGHLKLDIINTDIPQHIKARCQGPVFLNWQGFIAKDELQRNFDGKIFQRYGVKWHTLRLRVQRLQKQSKDKKASLNSQKAKDELFFHTKAEKCQELLQAMAKKAQGSHKNFIEACAEHNLNRGIELLEAIYIRLITYKDQPHNCPSRYINSSPIIAARILQQTLYRTGPKTSAPVELH